MADPFVAEIRIFPFNFAPKGWAFCNGQLMPLSQNTALFSLLGTTYGGDGKSTFALPDLQGRAPMHPGRARASRLHDLGETGGSETVTLLETEIPRTPTRMQGIDGVGDRAQPGANRVARAAVANSQYQRARPRHRRDAWRRRRSRRPAATSRTTTCSRT